LGQNLRHFFFLIVVPGKSRTLIWNNSRKIVDRHEINNAINHPQI
jgi:hypothetical protein